MIRSIKGLAATVAIAAASVAFAQTPPAEVTIRVEKIVPGVAVLFGQGGNIGVSYGPDGTVLIDDQFAPLTAKIAEAVASLGATPVKFLINTHWHFDHTGGNENFGKAGAVIMAHDNVRVRMMAGGTVVGNMIPPAPKVALPIVTWHDGLSLHLNGDEVRTRHLHNGHTDGDSIVHWKAANVVHMGDLFMNKVSLPFIDIASGGTATGFLAAIEKTLTLIDDKTVVIPGHGPLATKADLTAFRDMLRVVIGKVQTGMGEKKTLAQIQAEKPAAPYETKGGFISGDAFVKAIYESLSAPRTDHQHGSGGHVHE
ncbi:MAG: MBL fold metallo-hydrolase [Sphingomonadaceae bacterium]